MKSAQSLNSNFSGRAIAKYTIYNLSGYGIPLIFAVVLIPFLIKGLGEERFGILSLAWVIIGYFSFFDFGIGRAITQIIAEKIGLNQTEEIPGLFWTSFFLMLTVSIVGTLILLFSAPALVYKFFNISKPLQTDTLNTFYVLALSIPIVTTTAGIRGVLEAYQKFGIINIIRTFLGVSSFLGPLLCLIFTNSLFWIVLLLIIIRIIVWILYLSQCFKSNVDIKTKLYIKLNLVKPILKLSGWMNVSNVIGPIIVYLDRFLIGVLVSATAITFYSTPFEIISKLLLIPGALTGVLFPTFSANYINNPDFTKKLSLKAVKYIFILLYPIIFLIIAFSYEGMDLWLGKKFALNSSLILQLMAAGILFNSIAYVPVTLLQGIGRADLSAKVYLVELPIYCLVMWIAIKQYGINGAAVVWFSRMVIDALLFFILAKKQISFNFQFKSNHLIILAFSVVSILTVLSNNTNLKFISVFTILIAFSISSWRFLLSEEERIFLISRLKIFKN